MIMTAIDRLIYLICTAGSTGIKDLSSKPYEGDEMREGGSAIAMPDSTNLIRMNEDLMGWTTSSVSPWMVDQIILLYRLDLTRMIDTLILPESGISPPIYQNEEDVRRIECG